jgi:hypothetical protein
MSQIAWVGAGQPVLVSIAEGLERDLPLTGVVIGAGEHITSETGDLLGTLKVVEDRACLSVEPVVGRRRPRRRDREFEARDDGPGDRRGERAAAGLRRSVDERDSRPLLALVSRVGA